GAGDFRGGGGRGGGLSVKIGVATLTWLYYVLLEGVSDASFGKRICGLRVACAGRAPGFVRGLIRTSVFMLPALWVIFGPDLGPKPASQNGLPVQQALLIGSRVLAISLAIAWLGFTTLRRRNGYAAWHDLASGTRVLVRARQESRPILEAIPGVETAGVAPVWIGPYVVTGTLGSAGDGELLVAM